MTKNISIAIPDSCLDDETTRLDKSRKISLIARACAIFKVNTIYIYEHSTKLQHRTQNKEDRTLLLTILKYLDTPQFLRKQLFPKMNELKYAGVLHPLKIPSHITPANPNTIKNKTCRDGVIIKTRGKLFVDFGINMLLPYTGKSKIGKRITAEFSLGAPQYKYHEIPKNQTSQYWGYTVKDRGPLGKLLDTWTGRIILTSRKAKPITSKQIQQYQRTDETPTLLVYGSTTTGIHEILGKNLNNIPRAKLFNFFPEQATQTVRLEEAILGTLSILNLPILSSSSPSA